MANTKEWGALCPEGHGILHERDAWVKAGVAWCPHEAHGGNGRMYRRSEVEEGWFDPTKPTVVYDDSHAQRLAQRTAERTAAWEENRRKHMATDTKEKAPRAAKVKEPQACLCGCGGSTKGGRFLPGHDARYHARVKAAMTAGKTQEEAERLASKGPLPASLLPKVEPKAPKAETVKTAKPKRARFPGPDLTSRASDEPADEEVFPEGAPDGEAIEV